MGRSGIGVRGPPGDAKALASALVALLVISLSGPMAVEARTLSVEQTEDLVRTVFYEGLPEDQAERIGPEGAARLIEMLEDPAERENHARILVALGISGHPEALRAMRRWAVRQPREGEVDRATFRAWQALPYALGHLARHDRRAIGELQARLNADAPRWRFRHHHGARLRRQARRAAANSLGLTGLDEAGQALDRIERRASDPAFADHLRRVRALHAERARGRQR